MRLREVPKPICVFCGQDIAPQHMCFRAKLFWRLLLEEVGKMPTDIELFDMKERGILEGMTLEELQQEVKRGEAMSAAVAIYQNILLDVMEEKDAKS